MERLIGFFVDRHVLVHVMVGTLVLLGFLAATRLQREFLPPEAAPTFIVRAVLPGAAARDIETKVTIPIEDAIEEVDGIDTYYTVISENTSVTTIELFDDVSGEQLDEAELDIRSALDGIVDFPPEMDEEPVVEQFSPAKMPVIEVALSGPTEAVVRAAKRLERPIRDLALVSKVTLVGLQDPEVRILVDPVRLREHGATLLDVIRAVERRNVSNTGGLLKTESDRRQVVLWSRYIEPEEVADTVLRFLPDGGVLRVRDVARIESAREDTGLVAHTNGRPGISIVVRKRENADIIDAVDAIRKVIERIPMPEGVGVRLVNDSSFMTRNRLELIARNGVLGAILVAAVLFAFLTPRSALFVLAGIPVVFMGALLVLAQVGITLNMIALTGFVIVLGLVVDDAVVVGERIVALRQEGLDARTASVVGAAQMARPVIASATTTILAFIPLLAIGGSPGRIMWQMPAVVVMALFFSLLESFCILPSHMSGQGAARGTDRRAFMIWLESHYRTLLEWVLDHRTRVLAFAGVFLVVVLGGLAPRLPFVLFPQDDSDALYLKVTTPIGTPLEQTEAVSAALERQLPAIIGADLLAVTARIGHQDTEAIDRKRGSAENEAVVFALFKHLNRERTAAQWIQVVERRLVVPPGTRVVYEARYLGPPTDQPVTIHVASNDDEIRRGAALGVRRWLEEIPGLTQIDIDERPGTPQIDLNLDYEKLALRGLDAEDVALTLKAAFFGIEASEHRDLDDTTTFRVLFEPSARRSLDPLLETPVRSKTGQAVRIRDVVNPIEIPAVSRIYHRNGMRTSTVRASFVPGSGNSALSFADRVDEELLPHYEGVPGLRVYNGGEAVSTRRTTSDLGTSALVAVAGITVVIALMLGSFIEAAFVITVIPFAIAGVVVTFLLHGKDLSMFAMMGTIGLAGVVVNASIVMVDAIHRSLDTQSTGDTAQRREAMVDAVVSRLRPILVTTLTTLGGVLPTAYGIGGYDAMVSPMSLALGWGLALSTMITLLLVPVFYTFAADLRARLSTSH